ncbi:methylamine methyltransferase corrinoid protein reductive activase [Methanolobus sp. ZRKC3]|uniref:methylamine methyltransferase corrinoid protein reductive activase n=1 Tax=Methanolobus sp. ZRKC3 TaxID=3125786 RepID=UPI003252F366
MYGIALDLGTSGFRAQLINLDSKDVFKVSMTAKHPLPGGNITDHLDFAISVGGDIAHGIIVDAIRKVIDSFHVDASLIKKIVVCGNPIQLSLFQNSEIRDLAYAGKNMQMRLGIEDVKREARIFPASEIFKGSPAFEDCDIFVPPAIRHEIGADALAMMLETDFLDQTVPTLVTDYGTNAEMAIKVGDRIITASAAAGPAIEGQGIGCGMLASPGAISDVISEGKYWRLMVLDADMQARESYLIDPVTGKIVKDSDIKPVGITGTGVISVLSLAMRTGLIENPPKLKYGKILLGDDIFLTEDDIKEAGKAIGAIKAAQLTLIIDSGLHYDDLENMYMTGASGTYVDAGKAMHVGSCPDFSKKIVQFGNTSLALAREILLDESKFDKVIKLAHQIKADHLMMATSVTFKNFYSCELSYWTEGMSKDMYNKFLDIYGLPALPLESNAPIIEKRSSQDIKETGLTGVEIVEDVGITIEELAVGCTLCHRCEIECPENAITIVEEGGNRFAMYNTQKCLGTSCKRCVRVCPVNAINYEEIKILA